MILELHINGEYFDKVEIPKEESEPLSDCSFFTNVERCKNVVEGYVMLLKYTFFKEINSSSSYEIFLVIESKLNSDAFLY